MVADATALQGRSQNSVMGGINPKFMFEYYTANYINVCICVSMYVFTGSDVCSAKTVFFAIL